MYSVAYRYLKSIPINFWRLKKAAFSTQWTGFRSRSQSKARRGEGVEQGSQLLKKPL
ncbi:hypothetical protein EMIT0P43_30056 [Pseudomonas jessenii]